MLAVRMHKWKGVHCFLEHAAQTSVHNTHLCLAAVGVSQILQPPCESNVQRCWTTRVAKPRGVCGVQAAPKGLVRAMDIWGRASLSTRPVKMVMLDLMVLSEPVHISRSGGVQEITADVGDGVMTRPRDAGATEPAICGLTRQPTARAQLTANPLERAHYIGIAGLHEYLVRATLEVIQPGANIS